MTHAGGDLAAVERGVQLLHEGYLDEAFALLLAAEQAGVREASMVLADACLRGKRVTHDVGGALAHLERAAAQPWGPPEHLLAAIHRVGHGVPVDDAQAWHWLRRALMAGHPPALRLAAMLRDIAGDTATAQLGYEQAATHGDIFSVHALGLLAAEQGDTDRARELWACSPLAVSAQRLGRALPPRAVRTVTPWQARDGTPPWHDIDFSGTSEALSGDPRVEVRHDALSPVECDYLITVTAASLRRSLIVDPIDGRALRNLVRTSSEATTSILLPDMVVHLEAQRVAAFAGLPVAQAEPFVVLRYAVGEEYKPHYDWFTPAALAAGHAPAQGQRISTVLIYLNQVEQGGVTGFPLLGLKVAPREGSMLRFDNTDSDGVPDQRTLHCGEPIERGEKIIMTAWFRQRSFDPADRAKFLALVQ